MELDLDPQVAARARLVAAMQAGQPWDVAAGAAALPISRTAAYWAYPDLVDTRFDSK